MNMSSQSVQSQSSKVLKIISIALFCISIKLWLLTIIQKDEKIKEAKKPKEKTIIQYANRGPIYDRFDLPLALNRIKYNASIYYAQIRQIPSVKWNVDENGNKYKSYPRKEHIKRLSSLLSHELNLDADRIEDLIYSKASLIPHIPFTIKENIDEKTYYKLKILEKDFLGLQAERSQERFYPQKKVGSNVIGYMGPISEQKYRKIADEIKELQTIFKNADLYLPPEYQSKEEVERRLNSLKEKAYSVNDRVGIDGIEAAFDQSLRGSHGKKRFEVDVNGNFLKELEYKKPKDGEKLTLAISSELQEFCEELLAKDEKSRNRLDQKSPFIKGGSIVVMDPKNGQILALASFPRFDPNDFIISKKDTKKNSLRWLENKEMIKEIFNGTIPLQREFFNKTFYTEEKNLSFDQFLELILPKNSEIIDCLKNIKNIKNAIKIQENVESLLYFSKTDPKMLFDAIFSTDPTGENRAVLQRLNKDDLQTPKANLQLYLKNVTNTFDKLFVIDLCRMIVHSPSFSDDLINSFGDRSLTFYWDLSRDIYLLEKKLIKAIRPLFSTHFFKEWKIKNQKDFLRQKREEEKEMKIYSKPYIEHFDYMEKKLFDEFWQEKKNIFLTCLIKDEKLSDPSSYVYFKSLQPKENSKFQKMLIDIREKLKDLSFEQTSDLLKTIRSFDDLQRPLLGEYFIKNGQEKDLAASFYPKNGFGFTRSSSFQEQATLGSIFKIVVAYSALKNKNLSKESSSSIINPFTMIDQIAWQTVKNERLMIVGFTEDHKPIFRFYKGGRLPKSSHSNIGKIDIISALAQSSNPYFAILASDYIEKIDDLIQDTKNFSFASKTQIDLPKEIIGSIPTDLEKNRTGLYSFAIGQHTLIVSPLQTAVMLASLANGGEILKPQILKKEKEILKTIVLPKFIRNTILEGLDQTLWGEKGNARPSVIKKLKYDTPLQEKFISFKHKLVGKTSTAEVMRKLNVTSKAEKYNDIWFGGIYFEDTNRKNPELVIVVYLKYGEGGKEAAPLAVEVIDKYNQLKEKYFKQSIQ